MPDRSFCKVLQGSRLCLWSMRLKVSHTWHSALVLGRTWGNTGLWLVWLTFPKLFLLFSLCSQSFFKLRKLKLKEVKSSSSPTPNFTDGEGLLVVIVFKSLMLLIRFRCQQVLSRTQKHGNLCIYNRSCTGLLGKTPWK